MLPSDVSPLNALDEIDDILLLNIDLDDICELLSIALK